MDRPREIVVGGQRMADVRHLFPDTLPRPRERRWIVGLAVHHDGVLMAPGDRDYSGSTLDEDLERLRAIYNHSIDQGWKRFPYHFVASPNGRTFYTQDLWHNGSHVATRNADYIGLAVMGDYELAIPGHTACCAAGVAVAATWGWLMRLVALDPHYALAVPGWETVCPGATFPHWFGRLLAYSVVHATHPR